ncbi:ribulokinase [Alicyclobacillus contaminans]|uniref:ribulokinase n=1 Tax=Alicyclobacillus contaminans TaxID=392016 RepID=UPI00041FA338|nr:ribulokinase [Alicyclobacillus contaminans]
MAYTIGIDFGTLSGRVMLLNVEDGQEVAVDVVPYEHGVLDRELPTGEPLPPDWALQHPKDYLEVIYRGIPSVISKGGVDPDEVVGIGVDFTSCTVLPTLRDGTPLCLVEGWEHRPHAWPKLWKHHSAQPLADRMNQVARARSESFLSRYGGAISSEWYFPKLLQIFEEDREVYHASDRFLEAADWIVWHLTGRECRNSCTAGFKAMWSQDEGLPSADYFRAVHPQFENPAEKLGNQFHPLGTRAGALRAEVAARLGLRPSVAVAVGNVDAMVCVPSVGVTGPGTLVMVIGTSICHVAVSQDEVRLPGITGVVRDGVLPGMFGYETGQAAVGDMFQWFVSTLSQTDIQQSAERLGRSVHDDLQQLAAEIPPGSHGLVVLDWWNGNRSILGDADLSGVIMGLTLSTTYAEMYRALLESVAFGTRRILENFEQHHLPMQKIAACGGISHKNPLLMQIYADVCGVPVEVFASKEVPARGAAMFGAVAAGVFPTIQDAARRLASPVERVYYPHAEAQQVYDRVYQLYHRLYHLLGDTHRALMHEAKQIRLDTVPR